MQAFIHSHQLPMALGLWFFSSSIGLFASFICARALWKALAPHSGSRVAAFLGYVWFWVWIIPFAWYVALLFDAALIDFGAQQSEVFLLMMSYSENGIAFFGVFFWSFTGLYFYSIWNATLPQILPWWKVVWHIVRVPILIFIAAFVLLILIRMPAVQNPDDIKTAISAIQSQKITLSTVMGDNLPPQPYKPENDATVAGIDKNNNGIRDDVELAIFDKYPHSAKIRAAELQYALDQQMMMTQVFNSETWKAAAQEDSRGYACIGDTIPDSIDLTSANKILDLRVNEVEALIFNTQTRKDAKDKAYDFTTSFGDLKGVSDCDIDLKTLPN